MSLSAGSTPYRQVGITGPEDITGLHPAHVDLGLQDREEEKCLHFLY